MYTEKLKFPQRINSMHCVFPSVITYILAYNARRVQLFEERRLFIE